jgi:hypothetical protein
MMSPTWGERAVGKKRTRKGFTGSVEGIFLSSSKRGLTGNPVMLVFSAGTFWQLRDSRVCESVMRK